jgi:uncharacterized protein YjbJ (UPF0337 family)
LSSVRSSLQTPNSSLVIFFINTQGQNMNWDQIEGNWKQLKGNAKQQWGKLTDDHLDVMAGQREQMAGKIQELYGISKHEAEKQLVEWHGRVLGKLSSIGQGSADTTAAKPTAQ